MLQLAIRRGAGGNEGKRVSSGYNRRRRLATRSSGKQQAGRTAVRTAPIVCPEESHPVFLPEYLYPWVFSPTTVRRGLGASGKPPVRPQAQPPAPAGPDAPTPARIGTGRPKGRSHFSFGGERKVCKRKPAARRLREKALYCPFLKEGVRNVARSTVGLPTFTFVRARAHSFPLSKRARLFPSAAYRRSAPPQLAVGILIPCRVGSFNVAWAFCGADKWADFLCPVGGGQAYPLQGEMFQCSSYIFATQKAGGISNPRWPLCEP